MELGSFLVDTKKNFPKLEEKMTQVRRRGSVENLVQSRANVIRECGIATKLVALGVGMMEQRKALAAKLVHGIYDGALFFHLRLREISVR